MDSESASNPPISASDAVSLIGRQTPKSERRFLYNLQEWERVRFDETDERFIIGTPTNAIVRPGTKNIIEGAEKSFKTTMLYPLALGMACGHTVYPSLPVERAMKVLYLHGEMTKQEIAARQWAALKTIPSERQAANRVNFFSGRDLDAHLTLPAGQQAIIRMVEEIRPEILILDPWQSFIQKCDENSFKEISRATSFLDKLMADHRLTLFLSLHLGKDHSKGARGHSMIKGWRDTLIKVERKGVEESIKITVSPRWGDPPAPFKLKFRDGTMWPVESWTTRTTDVYRLLQNHSGKLTVRDLANELKLSEDAARKAAERAVEEGAICHQPRTPLYYIAWDPDESDAY
jgi:hypothetical protein